MSLTIVPLDLFVQKLESDLTVLEAMVDQLNTLYDTLTLGNEEARPKVEEAIKHANGLKVQAADISKYVLHIGSINL